MYGTFVTGGDDGFIRFWDAQYNKRCEVDTKNYQSSIHKELQGAITSIVWNDGNLAFGTRSGELYYGCFAEKRSGSSWVPDIDANKQLSLRVDMIVAGHSDQKITGITVSYVTKEFYTIGTNNILMKWNYETKTLMRRKKLNYPAKLLEVSPNNTFLAVGCYNGTVLVLNPTEKLEQTFCFNSEKKEITAMSFSQSNENLAVGYIDGTLVVLSSPMNFKRVLHDVNRNISPVIGLDFSEDNCSLKVTFKNLDTWFYDLSHKQKVAARQLADERWNKWRSPFGAEVQGIWSEYSSPSDVVGVYRNDAKDILVVWDAFGGVKAFNYPCVNYQAPFLRLATNNGQVSACIFNENNTKFFILGSSDASIVQFNVAYDSPEAQDKRTKYQDRMYYLEDGRFPGLAAGLPSEKVRNYLDEVSKIWPSKMQPSWLSSEMDYPNLEVRSCAGLNKDGFRNCLMVAKDESLIYFCGTVFVQQKFGKDQQSENRDFAFFHRRRVAAMDLSSDGKLVATGEAVESPAERALVVVHDLEKSEVLVNLELLEGESSGYLKFSPSLDRLICVSSRQGVYRVSLFDWPNSLLVQSLVIGKTKINDLSFRNDAELATVGDNHVTFWTIDGNRLVPEQGSFGKKEIQEITACCHAFEKRLLFTGTASGVIGFWDERREYCQPFDAHNGEIILMRRYKKETLFTAGSEGIVFRWALSDTLIKQAEVYDLKDLYQKQEKYLSISPSLSSIVLATARGDVVRAGAKDPSRKVFTEIASAITAVYFNEAENKILVATKDCQVHSVDAGSCRIDLGRQTADFRSRGVYICAIESLFNQGKYLLADSKGVIHVVGGNLQITDRPETRIETTFTQETNNITLMKVLDRESHHLLAVASNAADSKIEVYEQRGDKTWLIGAIPTGFKGYVTCFDWSCDGRYILANSSAGEMALLALATLKPVQASEGRDLEWATYTTVFNFFSSGLHSNLDGSTDVTAVCTRKGLKYLVAGTSRGEVQKI